MNYRIVVPHPVAFQITYPRVSARYEWRICLMRKAILYLTVFALAGSLWAAEPITGTWKLNVAKSKAPSQQMALKELIETYKEIEPDKMELTRRGIGADGAPFFYKYIYPRQGGIADQIGVDGENASSNRDAGIIGIYVAPGEWYTVFLKGGTQYMLIHKIISKDGKTMRQTVRVIDEKGKPVEGLSVFDKQ
jgi:hypothetical protein